jgi:hypothetical protein
MTQLKRLQTFLNTGQRIHRLTALQDLGIFELSARIGELTKSGYPIDKRRIKVVNRFKEVTNVVEYWKKEEKLPRVWPIKE